MIIKLQWCVDDNTPYIEREIEYCNVPTDIIVSKNPPDVEVAPSHTSYMTNDGLIALNNCAKDMVSKLTTLKVSIDHDQNDITFIDWL